MTACLIFVLSIGNGLLSVEKRIIKEIVQTMTKQLCHIPSDGEGKMQPDETTNIFTEL